MTHTLDDLRNLGLAEIDPEIARLCDAELARQRDQLELIASENFTWPSVLQAVGSVLTNKYAEGLPHKRYYGGCEVVDEVEELAIARAKELFGAEHANVQPHSGASANMAAYYAVLDPGDTVLGLRLDHGGHLTHGLKVNFSGRYYDFQGYCVRREDGRIDLDEVRCAGARAPAQADRRRRLGLPARDRRARVPRDRRRGRRAADGRHGALLGPRRGGPAPEPGRVGRHRLLDDAQDARGAARRLHPLPPGARAEDRPRRLPGPAGRAALPRHRGQGGLLRDRDDASRSATTSAPSRPTRRRSPRASPSRAASCSRAAPTRTSCSSTCAAASSPARTWRSACDEVLITVNRNTVPYDERPPTIASGVRIGTPAATMRGLDEADAREVGSVIGAAIRPDADLAALRAPHRRDPRAAPALRRPGARARGRLVSGRVVVLDHPVVRHKTTLLRSTETDTRLFRALVHEISLFVLYEATRLLPTEP